MSNEIISDEDVAGFADWAMHFATDNDMSVGDLRECIETMYWAENNPEEAMQGIRTYWANAGQGFREVDFNFRGAIKSKMDTYFEGD